MPKWRILIPVLIVAVVGVVAYMQMSSGPSGEPSELPPAAGEPAGTAADLEVTGDEDVEVQVDALVETMLDELDEEQAAIEAAADDLDALNEGESDVDILNTSYYEE